MSKSGPVEVPVIDIVTPAFTDGGWKQMTGTLEFARGYARDLPGWERDPATGSLYCVELSHTQGTHRRNKSIAAEWDDLAASRFHFSDRSHDKSIFVNDGDTYTSYWTFATKTDRDRFKQLYDRKGWAPLLDPNRKED